MTQADQILSYMLQGNSITPLEALNRFGCFRLGARIHDLKAQGHTIKTETVKENGKRFAKYTVIPKQAVFA